MNTPNTLAITMELQDVCYKQLNRLSRKHQMIGRLASFPVALMDVSIIISALFVSAIEETVRTIIQLAKVAFRGRNASLAKAREHAKVAGILAGLTPIALLCSSVGLGIQTVRICRNPTTVRSIIHLKP